MFALYSSVNIRPSPEHCITRILTYLKGAAKNARIYCVALGIEISRFAEARFYLVTGYDVAE